MVIKIGTKYLTRNNNIVKISRYNRDWASHQRSKNEDKLGDAHVLYTFIGDNFQSYTQEGKIIENEAHPLDLIQEINV